MSGEGVSGLDGLRTRVEKFTDIVADVRAEQAAQGATQRAQGREIADVKATVHGMDAKVDAMRADLATAGGVASGKHSSATGLKDVLGIVIGAAGVIAAIIVAAVK